MEEEFPLVPPSSPQASQLMDSSYLQGSILNFPRREGGVSPTLVTGEQVSFPIIEEAPPSTIGSMVPIVVFPNIELFPSVIFESAEPPLRNLLANQLQLIFDLRRDVAEQIFHQDILVCRLDAFFDSFSSEPIKSRCPTYSQYYSFSPSWPHPPNGKNNKDTSSV
jgi:hypothetical protein